MPSFGIAFTSTTSTPSKTTLAKSVFLSLPGSWDDVRAISSVGSLILTSEEVLLS